MHQVDWFFIIQMATKVPAGFLALYYVDVIGLKKSFWIVSSFGLIGTCVRLGGNKINYYPIFNV